MKKTLIAVFCLLIAICGYAQDVMTRTAYIFNKDRSLWYNSSSVAGLAREDIAQWRNISAGYSLANGKFTDSWGAQSDMGLSLNGDMLMELGTLKLLAGLNLEHKSLGKSKYNTSIYEVSWDMPYFAAINSDESFLWRQNHAALDLGVVSPLMIDDMLSAGISFKMDLAGASKKANPLCRYRGMAIEIIPSVTFAINEENVVGLSVFFKTNPSRSILSSDEPNTTVYFLEGLGERSHPRLVGGDMGIGPIIYDARALGTALQYNHFGDMVDWLLELSIDKWKTTVTENDILRGRVDKFVTGFTATGLFGQNRNRKLTAGFNYNLNYWLYGVNSTTVAHNGIIDGNVDYTVYTGVHDGGFNWMFGLGMELDMLRINRVNPESSFTSNKMLPYAFLGKDISIAEEQSLLARLKMGYNFASRNAFKYGGTSSAGNYFVNYMLDDELDYLSSYYLDTRLSVDYTYRLNSAISAYASLSAGLLSPMERNSARFILQLSVGTLF